MTHRKPSYESLIKQFRAWKCRLSLKMPVICCWKFATSEPPHVRLPSVYYSRWSIARSIFHAIFKYYSGIFYFCQFIKSFRPFHSFWEEDDLSWEINTSFTEWHIIISWVFSFRVIQPTVRWHTFKTFMFVFINFCSSKKLFETVGY